MLGRKIRKVLALGDGQTCLERSRRRRVSLKCGLLKPCFLMLCRKPAHATLLALSFSFHEGLGFLVFHVRMVPVAHEYIPAVTMSHAL